MTGPLLSIVIPTCNRPQLLPRAVDSALTAAPDGACEVIVVPNGPDTSWKAIAQQYINDSRIRWHPIAKANANIARNHGLSLSRGKFLRFLDDDDYLFEAACTQCVQLDASRYDASLGGVDLVDGAGTTFRRWVSDAVDDYVVSMLRPTRITHNCALLWRRDRIAECRWNTSCTLGQDTAWVLSLARDKDLSLLRFSAQTGVWVHHAGPRISRRANVLGHNQATASILMDTIAGLEARGALTVERRTAAAQGLWHCIHNAFPLAPRYWSKVVARTIQLVPDSRPDDRSYKVFPLKYLNPGLVEWLMTPHRLIRFGSRERARAKGRLPQW